MVQLMWSVGGIQVHGILLVQEIFLPVIWEKTRLNWVVVVSLYNQFVTSLCYFLYFAVIEL